MSQVTEPGPSDRVSFMLRRSGDIRQFHRLEECLAARRDTEPAEVSNVEVIREAMDALETALQLESDDRFQQTAEAIATDHGMNPEEISFEAAVQAAMGAYNGYNTGMDWDIEE